MSNTKENKKSDKNKHQLDETDFIELRDRFGDFVEFVVRDMVMGKGERWETKKE